MVGVCTSLATGYLFERTMKKPLPLPAIIGVVAVVLAIGIFVLMQAGAQGPDFKAPPVTGKTPQHILDQMSPEQRKKIEEEEARLGLTDAPEGKPVAGVPGAPVLDEAAQQKQQSQQPSQNPYSGK